MGSTAHGTVRLLEATAQRAVVVSLRASGAVVLEHRRPPAEQAGEPDLFIAHTAWTGHVEMKSGSLQLSDAQMILMRSLRARGSEALVLRAVDRRTLRAELPLGRCLGELKLIDGDLAANRMSLDVCRAMGVQILEFLRAMSAAAHEITRN